MAMVEYIKPVIPLNVDFDGFAGFGYAIDGKAPVTAPGLSLSL
jgi:hypothetical protein